MAVSRFVLEVDGKRIDPGSWNALFEMMAESAQVGASVVVLEVALHNQRQAEVEIGRWVVNAAANLGTIEKEH